MQRLLVVEDDARLGSLLRIIFRRARLDADVAGSVEEADLAIGMVQYAAIVLDRTLPDGDGLSLVRLLRQRGNRVPILVVTAKAAMREKVEGLTAGADDYLAKPFDAEEIVARVQAVVRRAARGGGHTLCFHDVSLDTASRRVVVRDEAAVWPSKEVMLLERLMRPAGAVVPIDALLGALSNDDGLGSLNALQVYLHRLRRRLSQAGTDVTVHCVAGSGYTLARRAAGRIE